MEDAVQMVGDKGNHTMAASPTFAGGEDDDEGADSDESDDEYSIVVSCLSLAWYTGLCQ